MASSPMMVMHSMQRDKSVGRSRLQPGTVRRVMAYAQPYRLMVAGYVAVIVAGALLALVPPLLFRQIIDEALPHHDGGQLNVLVGIIVAAALLDGLFTYAGRWWSSRIG